MRTLFWTGKQVNERVMRLYKIVSVLASRELVNAALVPGNYGVIEVLLRRRSRIDYVCRPLGTLRHLGTS